VRGLRERFPNLLLVMQNATSDVTRKGVTGGIAFPRLLDGISHEAVYAPHLDETAESQLKAWRDLGLVPGGQQFFIGTEDYVSGCDQYDAARSAYQSSRMQGFSPYAADASSGQRVVCHWGF
jgi:cysteinyl-tRNA synthetase